MTEQFDCLVTCCSTPSVHQRQKMSGCRNVAWYKAQRGFHRLRSGGGAGGNSCNRYAQLLEIRRRKAVDRLQTSKYSLNVNRSFARSQWGFSRSSGVAWSRRSPPMITRAAQLSITRWRAACYSQREGCCSSPGSDKILRVCVISPIQEGWVKGQLPRYALFWGFRIYTIQYNKSLMKKSWHNANSQYKM